MQAYRKAIAGALVTVAVLAAGAFGVEFPPGLEAAVVTLTVFVLGFVPLKEPTE